MKKGITVVFLVLAALLAAGAAQAIVLCDNENADDQDRGIEYNIKVGAGELIFGTASNIPCGGTARLLGSYTRVAEGFFFSIYVDQDPRQPDCCVGYELIGIWSNGAGAGSWYSTREVAECQEIGEFTLNLGACSAGSVRPGEPLRAEGPEPRLPGVRY